MLQEQPFRPDLPASAENAQRTGLSEMPERVSDLGGTLQVQSDAQGTAIVRVPAAVRPLRLLPGGSRITNEAATCGAEPLSCD